MTLHDLPERPGGAASETRQMVERKRTEQEAGEVSGRAFLIALLAIVAAIVGVALMLR